MITIRYALKMDKDFWFQLDHHLPESEFMMKVQYHQGYVLLDDNTPIAILRYNLFWDNIPFCTMLYVQDDFHRKGYGKKLMNFWENDMKRLGYTMVMTSTQVDENAQHFYRALGYQESGSLIINVSTHAQPMEMFFTKAI